MVPVDGKSNISMLGKLQEKRQHSTRLNSIDFVFPEAQSCAATPFYWLCIYKVVLLLHIIGFANQAGHLVLETS